MKTRNEKILIDFLLLSVSILSAVMFNGIHVYYLFFSWLCLSGYAIYKVAQYAEFQFKLDYPVLIILLSIAWLLLSLEWHPVIWQGVYYNWRVAIFFVAAFVAYQILDNNDHAVLFKAIGTIAILDILLTLFQSVVNGGEPTGLFINKNNNAAFIMLLILPAISYLLMNTIKDRKYWLFASVYALALVVMLQIFSRGAFVGMISAAIPLIAISLFRKSYGNIVTVIALTAVVTLLSVLFLDSSVKTFVHSYSRWSIWSATFQMIGDNGWLGIGNGMFYLLYPQYRHTDDMSGGFFVHNDYLQFLLELGLPGLLLFISFIVLILLRLRKYIAHSADVNKEWFYLGIAGGTIAVLVHSLVTFNLYKVGIFLVLGLYCGALLYRTSKFRLSPPLLEVSVRLTRMRVAILVVLMVVSLQSLGRIGYADTLIDGVFESLTGNLSHPEDKLRFYTRVHNIDPDNYLYLSLMAGTLSEMKVTPATDVEEHRRYDEVMRLFKRAEKLNPYAYELYIAEAEYIARHKDFAGATWYEKAKALANKSISLNPRIYRVRMKAATLMSDAGHKTEALGLIIDGLNHCQYCRMDYYKYGSELAASNQRKDVKATFDRLIREEEQKELERQKELDEMYMKS